MIAALGRALDRWIARFALAFAWPSLLLLIGLTVFDVGGRQFHDVGAVARRALEADLFLGLVMLSFAYAYLRNGHVRVDIVRERMRPRWIAGVELFGCLAIMLPLSWLLIRYGAASAWLAFLHGERSEAAAGLPIEWVVRSTVPLGFLLLLLSGVSVSIRNVLFLTGKEKAPAPQGGE